MSEKSKVAIIRHKGNVVEEVHKGLDLIGGLNIKSKNVIIKPNLCILDKPESGRTSDIRIVEALLKKLEGSGKRVSIVESGNFGAHVNELFEKLGYRKLSEKYDCELVDLRECDRVKVNVSDLRFKFPKLLLRKDNFFVSIGKLKTHIFERISCVLKNQWGCIAQIEKRPWHPYMNEVLYYLNSKIGIDLAIVDGIVGMGGSGPIDGHAVKTDLLLLGRDAVAVDSIASKVMGIDPLTVPSLFYAHQEGGAEIRPEMIEVVGENLSRVARAYDFIPERAYKLMRLGLRVGRARRMVNFGMLIFDVGNFMCPREAHGHGKPSLVNLLLKSVTSRKWKL